jgi:ribonuclease G
MSGELLINVTPSETRVALIENGSLQEVHIEREARRGLVGNIYLGKIIRVLPGMQAAFVDINLGKAAFLHASDINSKLILNDDNSSDQVPDIRNLVHEGQYIVVQVVKDPLGTKGARLTTDITIAARYLVLMPDASHAGISQRIEDPAERNRLKSIVTP